MASMKLLLFGLISCVCLGSGVVANCSTSTDTNLDQLTTACNLPDSVKVTSSSDSSAVADKNNCNTLYSKGKFSAQPVVKYANAKQGVTYTLVMIDPDAPNHPQGNYYLHWIVANIPGSDLAAGKVDSGTVVASYRGPAPPKNTGDHRYMFLVFEQTVQQLNLTEPKRPQFNLSSWVQSAEHLCGPLAGAQFKAHF